MERRHIALERSQRRKEAVLDAAPLSEVPPPPPVDPPPSKVGRPQKRSTYGLQRDYRVLEREKKVTAVLENHGFRAELENILQGQLEGKTMPAPPTRPSPEQWLADLRHSALKPGTRQPVASGGEFRMPINDLSGTLASKYTMAEKETRCKLAAVYRLVDFFGWAQLIYNHITACAPGGEGGYYINAFGLMYAEVTASNLVHVSLNGDIIDPGSTQLGINDPGLCLHSAIHKSRADIKCAIHLHNTATVAISVVNCGLLPVSTEANAVGNVSYCDLWEVEREVMEDEIARTLGSAGKVLILRNHGAVAMGESVEEALSVACNLVKACEIQVAAMSAGISNLNTSPQGVWSKCQDRTPATGGLKWKPGELQFEALMRMLDNKGYKTGYSYKSLELLQPVKVEKRLEEKQTSSNDPDEKDIQENEPPQALPINLPVDPEKELWEFLAEERKIPATVLTKISASSGSSKSAARSGETPEGSITEEGEGLDSLQTVAREVARSTGDAAQKISLKGKDLSSLELAKATAIRIARSTGDALQKLTTTWEDPVSSSEEGDLQRTAEDVAKSTADTLQGALLDMAQKTAERVARSTGDAVDKLASRQEELDPLEVVQRTAEHVAKSTSEVVERLRLKDHNFHVDPNEGPALDSEQDPDLDPKEGPALESTLDPTLDPTQQTLHSSQPNSPTYFLRHASPKATSLEQQPGPRTLNGTYHFLDSVQMHPAAAGEDVGTSPPPQPCSPAVVATSSNFLPLQSDDTRTLPSLPPTMLQHHGSVATRTPSWEKPPSPVSIYDKCTGMAVVSTQERMLPSLPHMVQPLPVSIHHNSKRLPSFNTSGIAPKSLTNGYQHSPLLSAHRFVQHGYDGSWTKFTDSDSEYSTTESVELTSQLLAPAVSSIRAEATTSDADLQTYPMLRMSHTAEMVSESTGKAVHKLTSTLS